MKKLDLMIIGAQKAGTTSLKNYLGQHSDISVHLPEEFDYFQSESEYKKGFERSLNKNFTKPIQKVLIAKNAGLYEKAEYLKKLKEHNANCKLVFLIRDPVERAFSSYQMEKRDGHIDFDFSYIKSILSSKEPLDLNYFRKFIGLSLYSEKLKVIYDIFDKKNVSIFAFEQFKEDPQSICERIFEIVGVDSKIIIDTNKIHNKKQTIRSQKLARMLTSLKKENNALKRIAKAVLPYKTFLRVAHGIKSLNYSSKEKSEEQLDADTRKILKGYFKPYNRELEAMTGITLKHWQ